MTISIEIFSSPGCSKCGQVKETLKKIATEIGGGAIDWQEVNILENPDYAVKLGVLSTPSIAIDGELVFRSLPSKRKLMKTLEDRLRSSDGAN